MLEDRKMRIVWHQQTLTQEKMNTLVCLQCTYSFPNPILFDYSSEVLNRLNNLFLAIGGTVFCWCRAVLTLLCVSCSLLRIVHNHLLSSCLRLYFTFISSLYVYLCWVFVYLVSIGMLFIILLISILLSSFSVILLLF